MHTFKQSEFGYRKIPRQSRSQKTVEYILIAAEAVVREHGSSDISTNKIAEKAEKSGAEIVNWHALNFLVRKIH